MLKGDLATTPLPDVLRDLAASASTGCVRLEVGDGSDAKVFLRTGRVYAIVLAGRRPQLGPRLVSSGDLDPAALAEAYDAQATELQGWRLGELLVHLGYVEQDVVEDAVGEQLREAAFELLLHTSGTWRFRVDERTREDVAPPVTVDELLADVALHAPAWEALRARVHGPDAVPVLSAAGTSPETLSLEGDAWSLLCTVDGTSTLSRLAGSSGLSLLEAAQVVVTLVDAGLVEIEPASRPVVEAPVVEARVPAEELASAPVLSLVPDLEPPAEPEVEHVEVEIEVEDVDIPAPAAVASRLAEALRGLGPVPVLQPFAAPAMASTVMDGESLTRSLEPVVHDEDVAGSLSRASESLAETLGTTTETFDPFALPLTAVRSAPLAPLDEQEAARRTRAAQELAERQAELELERADQQRAAREAMTDLLHDAPTAAVDEAPADEAPADEAPVDEAPVDSPDSADAEADVAPEPDAEPEPEPALDPQPDPHLAAQWQAAAFAELTEAAGAVPAPAAEPPVAPEPFAEPAPALGEEPSPHPSSDLGQVFEPPRGADTAALLRELSSLGLEDEGPGVPEQRPAAPQVVRPLTAAGPKKRKGLFGRG